MASGKGIVPSGPHRSSRIQKTFLWWLWCVSKVTPVYLFSFSWLRKIFQAPLFFSHWPPCTGIRLFQNVFLVAESYLPTYLLTYLRTYLLTNLLTHLLTVLLMDVPTYLRTYLPTDWLTYLLTYLLTDLLTNLFTYLLIYLPTHLLTYCIECLSSPPYFRSPQVS